jgi:signal transduction histidine kinase
VTAAGQAWDFGPRGPGTDQTVSVHGRRVPRLTVRLRLTMFYGAMFLFSGACLLAFSYALVDRYLPPGSRGVTPPAPPGGTSVGLPRPANDLHAFLVNSGTVLAVMVVMSVWLGWLMAGHVLRPLQAITAATRQISAQNLHWRLALPGPSDEITELGDTIDGLLARLEDAFEAQRGFVANASHELRTPLAMMRTSLDVAARKPQMSPDAAVLAGKVREGLDQAERLVESFLSLARAQHGATTDLAAVSLAALTAGALDTHAAAAASRGLSVRHHADGEADITGSRTLLGQMVGNIIDNAVRHNEPGGYIDVTTQADGSVTRLIVETGGPVLDPGDVRELARPFRRLGAARTGSGGTGLGLSIVAAIAAAHDGTLRLHARPQGGLQVTIELPRARPQARPQAAA